MLLEPADEKLIFLLLEASKNDLVLFHLVPKIKKDKYSLMFKKLDKNLCVLLQEAAKSEPTPGKSAIQEELAIIRSVNP